MDDQRSIVNRRASAEPFVSESLPDAPWPVASRSLLTERERSLYQNLLSLYPDHRIFVQVALSQMIDVDRNHPESESIRARYKQLVADFVLCRSDLSVVAVIELDDRSHDRGDRQRADARKNKALTDAGIRLIRIPAGALPSEDTLRGLIDAEGSVGDGSGEETALRLAETVHIHSFDTPPPVQRDEATAESQALKLVTLKLALGVVVLMGGWFLYSQVLPSATQRAFQPLAVRRAPASPTLPHSSTVMPARIPTASVIAGPSAVDVAEKTLVQLQGVVALQRQKDLGWAAFYSPPVSCEHPVDWNAQVECGNQYMRAKRLFERQWAAEHASGQDTGAAVVLDNGSIGGSRK
jgi:hypothetical protein